MVWRGSRMTEVRKICMPATFLFLANMYSTKLGLLGYVLCVSPSDCQVPEQSREGTHGY